MLLAATSLFAAARTSAIDPRADADLFFFVARSARVVVVVVSVIPAMMMMFVVVD